MPNTIIQNIKNLIYATSDFRFCKIESHFIDIDPNVMHCWGQRLRRGNLGVIQRSNCLTMPYGHQIQPKEPLRVKYNAGVKGHIGVIQGQPEFKLLRNTLWPLNLLRRAPHQSETQCWGQRSHRGHMGSTRGQIT